MIVRAVLDTNLFLRMLLARKPLGVASAMWEVLENRSFQVVVSPALLDDLGRVLCQEELLGVHRFTSQQLSDLLDSIVEIGVGVPVEAETPLHSPTGVELSRHELLLFATASQGKADFLVTLDSRLLDLELGADEPVQIVDARTFLQHLRFLEG